MAKNVKKEYSDVLADTLRKVYPFVLEKKKKPSVMDFLKNKKINKDESPPSSNHFQCDLVSFQLQTGQIKCPPAALPGDLSLTHQTPFHWPLLTKNMLSDAQTGFLAWSVEGQWWGEEV